MTLKEYEVADDAEYLYTCAQLKARETEFIEKSRFEKMTFSTGTKDFLKQLSETYYSKYTSLIDSEKNLDELMTSFNHDTIEYLRRQLKPEHMCVLNLLMYEENIHNFKILIKAFLSGENLSSLFLPSLYSYDVLMNEMLGQGFVKLDETVKYLLSLVTALKDRQRSDIRDIEIEFENKYMDRLYSSIYETKRRMLIDFIKHLIDITNIKNISRVKYANEKLDFDKFLIDNGNLTIEYLKKFENEGPDFMVQELSGSDYKEIIVRGINSLYSYNTFFSFEKNEYIFYLKFFENIKYSVANIEKIFRFFLKKKIELKIINMLYLGILYEVEKYKLEHKVEIIGEY
ncbi:MAG: V-type ATP synthase subunit C [Actinobacteria bacterium ADurb.Bin346]|nr:MAG: V-type ATP synthase subunit C [Actinobacteria bacterium ADurb.Bin346]